MLDLSHVDLNEKKTIELNGEWQFFPNRFIGSYDEDLTGVNYVTVPSPWDLSSDEHGEARGFGTYRLLVKVNESRFYAIKTGTIRFSADIVLNGEKVASLGEPSSHADSYIPESKFLTGLIHSHGDEIEILIQVANFDYKQGGILTPILFGTSSNIAQIVNRERAFELLVTASFILISIFFTSLYLRRERSKSLLFFCLGSLSMGIYTATMNNQTLALLFEYGLRERSIIQTTTMLSTSLFFLLFLRDFYKKLVSKKICLLLSILQCANSIHKKKGKDMSSKNVRLVYALDQDAVIDHVFDELSKHHARWPDDRAFVVVPEYLKADMERRYITGQKSQGLMIAEVLSFNRLATRLFTEAGQLALPSISLAGKAVLTQRALLDEQLPFQQFHRLAGRPGYALELVNILGDFTRYRISTDELRHSGTSEDTNLHEATRHKFSDFAILKETLDQSLVEKGLTDPDTALSRLAYLLQETPLDERLHFLRRCHIWVIGFGNNRELTSQELSVIHALSEQVSEMTVALSADSLNPEGDPAWQHGRETLRSLVRMFPETVPESLEGPFQAREPEVRFIRAVDRREEARYAAGEIRRLLLSGAVRRREIGIALCETDKTMAYLEPALSEYGIAAAIDSKRPLQNTSFIRMLSAFLLLCEYEFSFEDLIDYLKSGLVPLSLSSVDLFENTALALGWKRARQFRKLAEDELIINDAMARYLDPTSERGAVIREVFAYIRTLLELTAAMRQLRSGREKCRFLLNFLYDEMEVPVTRQRDRLLLEEREENARLLVSSWNAVVDFLTESENLLSDIRISQAHFGKLLSAGIEGLSLPFIPSGVDRVRVGPLNEMVHTPCKILMILGISKIPTRIN